MLIVAIAMMGCRQELQPEIPDGMPTGEVFNQYQRSLDYSTLKTVTTRENQLIWMVQFKADTDRIYATSSKGELLYERHIQDDKNGSIDLTKNGETVRITFVDGNRTIADYANARTATDFHGGSGFCQREKGETFGKCFQAESEEFCDSFVSCIALTTQPAVSIIIGIACSCDAKK